jgi:putative inorganic carbon (HCO3(-)) transporter
MELALAVMIVLGSLALLRGYLMWPRSPLDVPLLVFLGVLVTSTIARGPSWGALDAYRGLWIVGTYVAAMLLVENEQRANRLVRVLVLLTGAVAVYGVVQYFTGIDLYRAAMGRRRLVEPLELEAGRFVVIGFFPNSLTYGHSLIVPFSWVVAGTAAEGGTWVLPRAVTAALAALMAVALVLSTARGAWVAGVVVVVAACMLANARRRFILAAGATVLVAALFTMSVSLRARARSIVDPGVNAGRLAIYAANLAIVRDHPLLGVGFGNYHRSARSYYEQHPRADRRSHAHNSFLQVAAESGILGLGAFCYLFGAVLMRGWHLLRRLGDSRAGIWPTAAGAWLAVIGFLVGALTQDVFRDSECAIPMWFAVAVLMMIDRTIPSGGGETAHSSR